MKRRIAYAGAALTAVLATVALTAPGASAENELGFGGPSTSQDGPSTSDIDWGVIGTDDNDWGVIGTDDNDWGVIGTDEMDWG